MKFRKFVCALLVLLLIGLQIGALADPYIPETMTIVKAPDIGSRNISLDGVTSESDISKLKSSNKKVVSLSTFTYGDEVYIAIAPKKAGTTTVTFEYEYGGKTNKGKVKVTVLKYENPFKSLKIGSKDYASMFKDRSMINTGKALKGKLTIKLKDGWKLLNVCSYNYKNGEDFKSLAVNKKITVAKGRRLDILVADQAGYEREFYLEVRD